MVDFEFLKLTCSSSNAPLSLSRRIMLTRTISMLLYYLLQLPLVSLTIFRKLFFGMVDFEFLKLTCSSSNAPLSLSRRIMLTCTISMLLNHLLQLPLVSLMILKKIFFGVVEVSFKNLISTNPKTFPKTIKRTKRS
jgi:hypothetical protein